MSPCVISFFFKKEKNWIPPRLIVVVISRQVAVCRRDLHIFWPHRQQLYHIQRWALTQISRGISQLNPQVDSNSFLSCAIFILHLQQDQISLSLCRVVLERRRILFQFNFFTGNHHTHTHTKKGLVMAYITFLFSSISRQSCNYSF